MSTEKSKTTETAMTADPLLAGVDIVNHIHKFKINEQEIVLIINRKKGYWTCDIQQGETGAGGSSGGKFETLQEYVKKCENHHRYCYDFFKYGYKHAKQAANAR